MQKNEKEIESIISEKIKLILDISYYILYNLYYRD